MNAGALILAAGASSRLGFPKQLVLIRGETLLGRTIRIASEAGCSPIVVVLGASEELIRSRCDLRNVVVVSATRWMEGMGASISEGVASFGELPGIVVMTCDMPAVSATHLRRLAQSGELTASSYGGRQGVPAYFPHELVPMLVGLKGDTGAKELLRTARAVELIGGELDVDKPEDLARCGCDLI